MFRTLARLSPSRRHRADARREANDAADAAALATYPEGRREALAAICAHYGMPLRMVGPYRAPDVDYLCPAPNGRTVCLDPIPCAAHGVGSPEVGMALYGNTYRAPLS